MNQAHITPTPWWRRPGVVAGVVAVLCYVGALPNDYCYDGREVVRDNPRVTEPGQWGRIWTTDHWSFRAGGGTPRDLLYRPVSLLSYRIVRVLAATGAPWPQHLVNILLHALASIGVVALARRLVDSPRVCMVAGLLFAVMPIHSEVIAGIVGRSDMMAACGVLVTLLCHRRIMGATSSGRWPWYVLGAMAAFVAMGSKESGISVCLLVPLFDTFWHRSPTEEPGPRPTWWQGATLRRMIYLLIPLGVYLGLRFMALGGAFVQTPVRSKTINMLVDAPLWQHVLGVIQLWGMYWSKMLWPQTLCVTYTSHATRLATGIGHPHVLVGLLVIVGLLIVCLAKLKRGSRVFVLLTLSVLASYAVTANAVVLLRVFFAERIWYLPSVFAAILLAALVAPLLRRWVHAIVVAAFLLGMAGRCWIRNMEWANEGTLFASAYRDHPRGVQATYLFGQWLVGQPQADFQAEGIRLLEQAVEMDPGFVDAQYALGLAYNRAGRMAESLAPLLTVERFMPDDPALKGALADARRVAAAAHSGALEALRDEAKAHPSDASREVTLLHKLGEVGLAGEARGRCVEKSPLFAGDAAWQHACGTMAIQGGAIDEAVSRFETAAQLAPEHAQYAVELAMLYLQRLDDGDRDKAKVMSRRAMTLAPSDPIVLVCRAELLAMDGSFDEARTCYRKAISAVPADDPRRGLWEQRLALLESS